MATVATASVSAHGLGKRYGERWALRQVSFEAALGERVAITGPNGAGKTTLLEILAGIQPPTEGSVGQPGGVGGIGWVPQQPAVYSKLSVRENLALFARLERVADVRSSVEAMLEQTGLGDRAGEEVGRLSGGSRQRLNIAIGLLSEPAALLLDEPSSSLDPRQRERLWEFIGDLAEGGTTIVWSTHNVQEAERCANRLLVLADGELVFAGSPRALEEAVGAGDRELDFEAAFVAFLHEQGH
ncbi:MAG: ABC transporter ATP-binding protein [Solirubrobacteraceae bacterium]